MRRIWGRYRGLRARWQVVLAVVLGLVVIGGLAGDDEEASTVSARSSNDIADELPFASTTTRPAPSTTREVIRTTTTAAPTTTTTVAPTTTTTVAPTTTAAAPPPPAPPTTQAFAQASPPGGCHPSYDPCVPFASDVDCASGSGNGPAYTDTVRVIGPDEYDLDRDNDGFGCEP